MDILNSMHDGDGFFIKKEVGVGEDPLSHPNSSTIFRIQHFG